MRRLLAAIFAGLSLHSHAGVVVVQNVSPGATAWPGSPILNTMANPSSATVTQCFTNGMTTNGLGQAIRGNTNLAQTFTITGMNYTLQQISLYAGGGTGTGTGTNVSLRLHDLGFQTGPEPTPYGTSAPAEIISENLLGSGAGLSIAYSNQANGILEFDFTGSDQVLLQKGHMYAFELTGVVRTRPLNWLSRTSGSSYSAGAAYTNRSWLNGSSACEFSLAVYGTPTNDPPAPSPLSATATVNWANLRQRIDGFGASSAWGSSFTAAQADTFFSTNTGIGLSLLRSRIAPGATTVETNIMKFAQARGARVWSSPWSPAVQFKSNGNVNGGSFLGDDANYQAYASQLAGYVARMKNTYGINLYAISIQNEPDANVTTYESCNWTAQQIHDFVPYLYGALAASNVASTKIMLPESQNWPDYQGLVTTTMNDPVVATNVGIIADHNYDGATGPGSLAKNSYGKALWETEVSLLSGSGSSIYNGVHWAGRIHAFMTLAQANAWHHWWLISGNTTPNQGLMNSGGSPTRRMYVLGNFSRFVRPNFYRVGVITNSGVALVSAYMEPNSGAFAIVAINSNPTNAINLTLNLTNLAGGSVSSVTPWVTSSALTLSNQPAVAISGSSFTYTLPGPSVVTFVGQGLPTNSPPSDIALSGASVPENQPAGTMVGAFSSVDPDSGSSFTYSLVSGAGSADNTSFMISGNTLRTAASFNYEIKNSCSVRVRSADQFGLTFEKVFTILVTDVNEAPTLTPIADQTINAGVSLALTSVAVDPDQPPQTLSFTLLGAVPAGAALDGSSGVFTWRPRIDQADTTNLILVQVADNGAPVLTATNRFTIAVNPVAPPVVSSIAAPAGQINLEVSGILGPDYSLLTSTNLADWQTLFTTNPTAMPFTFVDTSAAEPLRFYRLKLGP